MSLLILGLVLFLGVHSVRIVADGWRTRMRERLGEGRWKGLYSLLSFAGLIFIVWGYGLARQDPVLLWSPPVAMRHAASLFTLVAFILLAAAYVPRNALKAKLLESPTLVQQASGNTKEQFSSSPDLAMELMNAIMDALAR